MLSKTIWSSEPKREPLHWQYPPLPNLCVFLDKLILMVILCCLQMFLRRTHLHDSGRLMWKIPTLEINVFLTSSDVPWRALTFGLSRLPWWLKSVNVLLQQEHNWELKQPELEMIQVVKHQTILMLTSHTELTFKPTKKVTDTEG